MRKSFPPFFHIKILAVFLALLLPLTACSGGLVISRTTPTPATEPAMVMPTTSAPVSTQADRPSAAPVTGPRVTISNFTFTPATLTVPAGSTVTWINQDDTAHTVTSVDKVFASQALDTGDQFAYKFTTPGTYSYFCSLHPKMVGKIIVQ